MAEDVAVARKNDPLRNVGLTMAKRNISQLPIVGRRRLSPIITERNLARMYVQSRAGLPLSRGPVSVGAMVEVLEASFWSGRKTGNARASCGSSR